jgi:hypothetical protein
VVWRLGLSLLGAWVLCAAWVLAAAPAQGPAGPQVVSFERDIMPLLNRAGCNQAACHGAQAGKGGLSLSLFAAEPEDDFSALTRSARGRRINRVEPEKSLLLLKPAGALKHEGGRKLEPGSPQHKLLLNWIAQGTPRSAPGEAPIISLQAGQAEQMLQKGASARIRTTAIFADDTRADAAQWAVYRTTDAAVATVDEAGRVTAVGHGQAYVIATALRQPAVVRIIVPQPLPAGFPAAKPNNRIDELVLANLKKLGLPPSQLSSDREFLRRVYIDVIGTLPTPDEARAFMADKDPGKRARLIEQLLARDEFNDFWALKWGDLLRIKSEYPVRIWPKAVETYHRWLRQSIADNKPYDQFARELLTATGSNFRVGPANFVRAVPTKDAQTIGETASLLFMGARMGCARCHGHPTETWGPEDNLGIAAHFSRVAFKSTLEWKEEIVYTNPRGVLRHPRTRQPVAPRVPGGEPATLEEFEDPRGRFADWLTAPDNPYFAKNLANRTWFWLMGRGIVHEPDDLRPTNPPSNPELLDHLAAELVASRYDIKHLFRLILNSRTYQLSSIPNAYNKSDSQHFSRYIIRRLPAEVWMDAIGQVTLTSETFSSRIPEPFTRMPPGWRAIQLADGNIESAVLELMGRPPRDTPYECERDSTLSMRQALYLVNSDHLENKVTSSPRIKQWLAGATDEQIVEELYLLAYARLPADEEKRAAVAHLSKDKKARPQALQDLVWAILNTREFLFNH